MRHRILFWILLSLTALFVLWATPASAGLETWYFGGAFNVGGVHFRVGYAEAGPFGSSFYFEAAQGFNYRGYGCSSYCYRRGPRYYHHPSCAAVHHHFGHHGYAPGYFLEHYGPPVPYRPPVHYYSPPRWNVHYYGTFDNRDRYYRDRYYRDKHGKYKPKRGRSDRYWEDRHRYDRDRRRHDRHDRGHRNRDDRDRHNGGRFDPD